MNPCQAADHPLIEIKDHNSSYEWMFRGDQVEIDL